jgi:hypothetical protein
MGAGSVAGAYITKKTPFIMPALILYTAGLRKGAILILY